MKEVLRYSEAFKLQVVRDIESGRYGSCHEATIVYGIRGPGTVASWVRHYGKSHLLRKVVRVETADERREIERLRAEVKEFQAALSEAHLELRLERSYLKLACRAAGEQDVDVFKKNTLGRCPRLRVHGRAGHEQGPGVRSVSTGRDEPPELLRSPACSAARVD